jgi:hypothetical protein
VWDGGSGDYYFDKETGLLLEEDSVWERDDGRKYDRRTLYSDYREFDGLKMPYRRTTYVKGEGFEEFALLGDVVLTELKLVETIPDDVFVLPKGK